MFQARCHTTEDNRSWIVVQSRDLTIDGGGEFNRTWQEYLTTFGSVANNYWLGLRIIREIIQIGGGEQVLRIALQDENGNWDHSSYDGFKLDTEENNFAITVSGPGQVEGSLGPGMVYLTGAEFTTFDDDNSGRNCGQILGGGWWYYNCLSICLNGKTIKWPHWRERKIVKSLVMVTGQKSDNEPTTERQKDETTTKQEETTTEQEETTTEEQDEPTTKRWVRITPLIT